MSKAVLISIQPKWCELIASGKKTVEVRKTRPKIDVPFKCYIYCTKAKEVLLDVVKDGDKVFGNTYHGKTQFIKSEEGSVCDMWGKRQKVIGEFVCNYIENFAEFEYGMDALHRHIVLNACISYREIYDYLGFEKCGYGWHISNLIIYDKPKELGEFFQPCIKTEYPYCKDCEYGLTPEEAKAYRDIYPRYFDVPCRNRITRPPQSWCYVEEKRTDL